MKKLQETQTYSFKISWLGQPLIAIRAGNLTRPNHKTAIGACGGVSVSERRPARNAVALPKRICRPAMLASYPRQPVRQSMRRALRRNRPVNNFPDLFAELDVFDILRQIVKPAQQAERISDRRPSRLTEARGDSQPSLITKLDHDPIFNFFDANRQGGLPSGHGACMRCDLNSQVLLRADNLRVHIPAVKLRHKRMSHVVRFDVSVKNSSVHVFDYNALYKRRRSVVAFHLLKTYT